MSEYSKVEGFEETPINKVVEYVQSDFSLGQTYDDKPAEKIVCVKCGSDRFEVGSGHCLTVLRCPNCRWEAICHEG